MTTDFIFAYGASVNRSNVRSWLEANGYDSSLMLDATPATLEGYDYVWDVFNRSWAGGTANIEHKEGASVKGVLIEIDEHLLKAFDRKEGHPYFYSRGGKRVPVKKDGDGKTVMAWVYVGQANKGDKKDVWPSREYKRVMLEAAAFWGFPEDYVEKIKAWPTS